jgi:hypothetical protein
MPKVPFKLPSEPLLSLTSYARSGPTRRDRLSHAEIAQIRRTVQRAPEVVVKVLPRGRHDVAGAAAHFAYISRQGDLKIATDEGDQVVGSEATAQLLDRWGLELEAERPGADLQAFSRRKAPKLFHKVTFSMPPGTPPAKVLRAVQDFAREELALQHRYATVLHTDEPHPHVHLIIKSLSDQGTRLRIQKATLRDWRRQFAYQLEARGVPANATERAVRGKTISGKSDAVFRTAQRRESRHIRARVESVARDVFNGHETPEPGRARLLATRKAVEEGWLAASELLKVQGYPALALEVRSFVAQLPRVRTERDLISEDLRKRIRAARVRDDAPTR